MNTILKKIVWLIMLIPALYLGLVWNKIPQQVAMHYDLQGNPDRYGSKNELLTLAFVLIVMNALSYLILTNIYRIDPKKYAAENKGRLQRIGFLVVVFIAGILCLFINSAVSGSLKLSMGFIFAGIGLLFAAIGNYMPNLKPNYFAGLRLPWTLENEENWRKTHAMAGKLWFGGGLLLAVICLFTPPITTFIIFFAVTFIIVIIPCIYSYKLYRKQKS
ncbi:MAG TPA: SdpI family protein [Chitinophagaceae bacterium]|nr:SdpI family protein [Chitinophagaceae bacterium]